MMDTLFMVACLLVFAAAGVAGCWAAIYNARNRRRTFESAEAVIAWLSRDDECEHDWHYLEREPGETYTGYCERCSKCGEIVQVAQ